MEPTKAISKAVMPQTNHSDGVIIAPLWHISNIHHVAFAVWKAFWTCYVTYHSYYDPASEIVILVNKGFHIQVQLFGS